MRFDFQLDVCGWRGGAGAGTGRRAGARGGAGCGGHLQGPHGVIQTPNFPDAFPVPIRCKWVISHATPNGTISIYFTQQYTTTGLTFTEYMYYDDTYKRGERKAFTVTDENITRVKWLQPGDSSAGCPSLSAVRYLNSSH
ncbi:unnamed protein product [Plutella xylostella]|uniref:(diamondback moth) hypothetical protein n=1 Tax=Plutella xylostella TaxID=51655 RepID=A0A8S4GA95_PLUXY|nr:unnamed protein product [Plutella xylostella]